MKCIMKSARLVKIYNTLFRRDEFAYFVEHKYSKSLLYAFYGFRNHSEYNNISSLPQNAEDIKRFINFIEKLKLKEKINLLVKHYRYWKHFVERYEEFSEMIKSGREKEVTILVKKIIVSLKLQEERYKH